MFYYSKTSGNKIVHLFECKYVKRIKKSNRRAFYTMEEARVAGYRACNCCSPISKRYHKEQKQIEAFSQSTGLSCLLDDGTLIVSSPYSQWKIITAGKKHTLFLYHKNENNFLENDESNMLPGYHSQNIHETSILGYLNYIISHDEYRIKNPLPKIPKKRTRNLPTKSQNLPKRPNISPVKPKNSHAKPQKGTKRWKKEQEEQALLERKCKIDHVLFLIDNLILRKDNFCGHIPYDGYNEKYTAIIEMR